jgi:signal transduction histidine kinase
MVLLAWLHSVVAALGQKSPIPNLPTLTHVEQIRRMQQSERATLHFSVRDTGTGVPLNKQKSVFVAFALADGSTSRSWRSPSPPRP